MVMAAAGMLPKLVHMPSIQIVEFMVQAGFHMALAPMGNGSTGFGNGGVEEIGPHGRCRVDAEQQHQQGGHQRAAANAGESDDDADCKTGKGVENVHGVPQKGSFRILAAGHLK